MKRKVWLVDVDGTVALRIPGGRGPFDWARVSEDVPNEPVIRVVRALITAGETVLFMSGRNEVCFADTGRWIDDHVFFAGLGCAASYAGLLMRPDTKEWRNRPDNELKAWLYETKVTPFYDVVGVLDDRDKVVKMWRSKGLTCLQVAEGNF